MAELMRRGYMAAVTHTDANVGRVLARLAELQMDRNTLVVFTSKSALHSLPPSISRNIDCSRAQLARR